MISLSHRLVGAFAAAALLLGSAAQALVLHQCGAEVRTSCCCEKDRGAQQPSTLREDRASCCATLSVPSTRTEAAVQAQRIDHPLPAAVPVAFSVTPVSPADDGTLCAARPTLRGAPLILLNCSLLI